jgi:N-acetyl-alpha-D-glucosaminyl L-malate synthase BshA
VLMHISNFRPVKRVRDIVQTFAKVQAEVPALLVMVGDGPERSVAESEVRELGIADHVLFLGKIDEVAPLLAGADIFLLPSNSESFGLSALEALASGVPVIGANVGGLPGVVKNGVTGFLCDVGDVDGMARATLSLLQDPERWQAASTAAAKDARERFSQNTIVEQYEALYEQTLATSQHA